MTNEALADRVAASESTSSRHRRNLESAGVIRRYVALVDESKAGFGAAAFVLIAVRSQQPQDRESFETAVGAIDEVMECHSVAGKNDYLLRVIARDVAHYRSVVERLEGLSANPHVESLMVLQEVFRKHAVPV